MRYHELCLHKCKPIWQCCGQESNLLAVQHGLAALQRSHKLVGLHVTHDVAGLHMTHDFAGLDVGARNNTSFLLECALTEDCNVYGTGNDTPSLKQPIAQSLYVQLLHKDKPLKSEYADMFS